MALQAEEKQPLLPVAQHARQRNIIFAKHRKALAVIVALVALAMISELLSLTTITCGYPGSRPKSKKPFSWGDVSPSTSLKYVPCFGEHQCARLEVPMDWNETTPGESDRVVIAILKKPSKVDVTDPRYGGVILFNPGGPGGSGVSFLLQSSSGFEQLLDSPFESVSRGQSTAPEEEKYFDLLSWDPRGVNNTTPAHGCITDPVARQTWMAQDLAIGCSLQDQDVFRNIWSRDRLYGQTCVNTDTTATASRLGGQQHLVQHIGTANVVRDMVEIIERHGEWREQQADTLLSHIPHTPEQSAAIQRRTAWHRGEEQLQYWGFSYGSMLGQAFASMQPHRVERMVLDGVVDPDDYTTNKWTKNIVDIDAITSAFADACFAAGPAECAFHSTAGADAIVANFTRVLDELKAEPIAVIANGVPVTITYTGAIYSIFQLYYFPVRSFRLVGTLLHEFSTRNTTALAHLVSGPDSRVCDLRSGATVDFSFATPAIVCTDGDGYANRFKTQDEYAAYGALLRKQSPIFGDRWARISLPCSGFDARAKWRFEGPFGGKTANPVIFASQSLDPVTPLMNAVRGTELFEGSVVIEVKGAGHCSLSTPSLGAMLAVRNYFRTGELPENGTRYEPSMWPFMEEELEVLEKKERRMVEAGSTIAEGVRRQQLIHDFGRAKILG
ncbi:hypothetical protein MMC19_002632 [Ptychographa xylographoides]|nr:hypothetical protein [Ptychographa xylographoides]